MIPVVIVQAESQKERVQNLVRYCKELDGTEVTVLEGCEGTNFPYPHCNTAAFHYAAAHFKGVPFIWLEPDSTPLLKGWRERLIEEYIYGAKEFMLSSDSHPPHDLVGGIGIYGPRTHWLMPKVFANGAWDGWMIRHLPSLIHFTPLIQHSYGRYGVGDEPVIPHMFPQDQAMIRHGACIFHRDVAQGLMGYALKRPPNRFLHSGDLGDIIAAMPAIRQLGGGQLVITETPETPGKMRRETMRGSRYEILKPLLEREPYITGIEWSDEPEGITHDFTGFRAEGWNRNDNLAQWQGRHLGLRDVNLEPWLTMNLPTNGRVIAARSLRYHNPEFPWHSLVYKFIDRIAFIGLKEEHEAFEAYVGRFVPWVSTRDFLQVAEHVATASLCIMNQSAPFWVAAGLGKTVIQESAASESNSVISRSNTWYSRDREERDRIATQFLS